MGPRSAKMSGFDGGMREPINPWFLSFPYTGEAEALSIEQLQNKFHSADRVEFLIVNEELFFFEYMFDQKVCHVLCQFLS